MQQTVLQYLADIVAAQGQRVFTCRPATFNCRELKKGAAREWVEEVYLALGGKADCWNMNVELPEGIETEQVRLSLDGSLQFNRYRAITFNSILYQKYQPSWLPVYRRNCHSLERECLKDGSKKGVWTNPLAEQHFGKAQDAGDFFGTGAPGWKLKAFEKFLADVYLFKGSWQHKRISVYERLMIQGKLIPLQQLLLSRSENNQQYLVKYLSRQLEIHLPMAE